MKQQLTDCKSTTDKPARILLFPSAYYPNFGGVEEICRLLAESLRRQGFEVAIAVNRWPANTKETEVLWDVPVHRFDFAGPSKQTVWQTWRLLPRSLAFNKFMEQWKPDIVHVICPSVNSFYLWISQLRRKCKVVVTLQGELFMDQHDLYGKSLFARWSLQQLLNLTDAVTACSRYVLDDAARRFCLPKVAQKVVFNGVDLTESNGNSTCSQNMRKYILGVGRMVRNKDFDTLIRGFEQLSGEFKDLDLVLAGDGDHLPHLRQLADQLKINERVHFVGRQERAEIGQLFAGCSCFIIPSAVEPFGIVCLEAMRAGKATIACNAGGPPEFIVNGENGLLVHPRRPAELASAMRVLLSDTVLRERLGARAYADVQSFSWTKITSQYINIYRDCLSQNEPLVEVLR